MKHKNIAYAVAKAALLCIISTTTAFGSGFALYEGSAAGNADTAGVTAKGGEPGAIFFNPAGITTVPGTQVQGGVSVVAPKAKVQGVNPYTGEKLSAKGRNRVWPLPHAYMTHQLNDDFWLGFGIYTRFGLGAEFHEDWFGRYNNTDAKIVTFILNPVVAWKASDSVSLSAGLSVEYFDITLKQMIDGAGAAGMRNYNDPSPSPFDIRQEMDGDDFALGFNLGITLKPVEKLSVGAAYHSRIKHRVDGDLKYTKPAPLEAAMGPHFFRSGKAKGTVELPDMLMTAFSYDFTERLTAGFGITFTHWSTYDELLIRAKEHPILPGKNELRSDKDWSNTLRYTAGASYELNESVTLRASYTYDESPLRKKTADYLVPAHDRHIFAIGCGYKTGEWVFDGSYFFEVIENMNVPARVAEGVMPETKFKDGLAHCFGISVTRKF